MIWIVISAMLLTALIGAGLLSRHLHRALKASDRWNHELEGELRAALDRSYALHRGSEAERWHQRNQLLERRLDTVRLAVNGAFELDPNGEPKP